MTVTLPDEAQAVWAIYQTMAVTKQRHFDYLQTLEDKYEKYGQPSTAEKAHLERLLTDHDRQVKAFRSELTKLKIEHPGAYGALVQKLSSEVHK